MSLANEDSLRLNVMLANSVAIRINDGTLTVYGLMKDGRESRVALNPNCGHDQYIKQVRELLSSTILGSPGGYPVFLKRWTRMGQVSDARLDDLLMLGEPEAVVAVSGADALTDELARRAWWAMPDASNARRMLRHPAIVEGDMGKVLAEFLLEFLPFEEEPRAIIESVELVLQPSLITEDMKQAIWQKGRAKSVFRIGFLKTLPDELPEPGSCRCADSELQELNNLVDAGNRFATLLIRLLSAEGQSYLSTCEWILKKPSNQDSVVAFLESLVDYFGNAKVFDDEFREMDVIARDVTTLLASPDTHDFDGKQELIQCLQSCPQFAAEFESMLVLAHSGVPVINPIFSRTDAVGSVMRKKIEPVSGPIGRHLKRLRGTETV